MGNGEIENQLRDEADIWLGRAPGTAGASSMSEMLDVYAAEAEARKWRDMADAERYRWLKANCQDTPDAHGVGGQLYFGTYAAGGLDAAIDSAIANATQQRNATGGEG